MKAKIFITTVFVLSLFIIKAQQWQPTNGPYGGLQYCLATKGDTIFMGGTGIFISNDNGAHWVQSSYGLPPYPNISSIVIHGDYIFASTWNYGVFKSNNNGASWQSLNCPCTSISTLVFNGNTLFAAAGGSSDGIYSSADSGATWATAAGFRTYSLFANDNAIFATGYGLIDRSTDNGATWQYVYTININPTFYLFTCFAAMGDTIFAGSTLGVFISTDNGTTWDSTHLSYIEINALGTCGDMLFAGTAKGVFMSADYGNSWERRNDRMTDVDSFVVNCFTQNGTGVLAGTNNGPYSSDNCGQSWQSICNNLTSVSANSLVASGNNVFLQGSCIYVTKDNGDSWSRADNGLIGKPDSGITGINAIYALTADGNNVYAGGAGVYLTMDTGAYWACLSCIFPADAEVSGIDAIAAKGDTIFISIGPEGLLISTNKGQTWNPIDNGMIDFTFWGLLIDGGNVFTSSEHGVYVSSDNGSNWKPVLPIGGSATSGDSIIFSFAASGEHIFGMSTDGLFESADNGNTWKIINGGWEPYNDAYTVITRGDTVYVGASNTGVYISTDTGASWSTINEGLPNLGVSGLAITDNYLFAAVYDSGVWRRSLSDIATDIKTQKNLQLSIYPNPTGDHIIVSLQNTTGSITFGIYDIAGNKILTGKPDGSSTQVNVNQFAAGMYFMEIDDNEQTVVKKFIIQR